MDINIKDSKFVFQFDASTRRSAELAHYGISRRYSKKSGLTKFWCDVTPYNWEVLWEEFPYENHDYCDKEIKAISARYRNAQQFKTSNPVELINRFKAAGYEFKKYEPLKHQANGLAFAMAVKKCGLFFDTGLGKTYIGATMTGSYEWWDW